ncbi:hypothetical protein EON65_15645 [archaeon]|nr:MAG: hypothetical protein EON65_15645 [archaeon]
MRKLSLPYQNVASVVGDDAHHFYTNKYTQISGVNSTQISPTYEHKYKELYILPFSSTNAMFSEIKAI